MTTTHPDAAPSTTIDLAGLPEPVIQSIKQLVASLREGVVSAPKPEQPKVRPTLRGMYNQPAPLYTPEMFKRDRLEAWANFPREFPEAGES